MKKILKGLFLSFILTFAFIANLVLKPNCVEVNAASTNKYILDMSYTKTYTTYGSPEIVTNETGTTIEFGGYNPRTFELYIYGTSHNSSVVTAENGHLFNFSDVTIAVETDYDVGRTNQISSYSIRGIDGTVVASSTTKSQPTTLYSGNLQDGSYYINLVWYVEDYMTSQPNYTKTTGTYSITYSFVVDGNAPTITGATTSTTYYKNDDFTISASDSGSGVASLYVKAPNTNTFTETSNPIAIENGKDGLYTFYAVDNAGNTSLTHYVYYDGSVPIGKITNSSGTTITSSATNVQFYYNATDSASGIFEFQWKTPTSSVWKTYADGTLTILADNGTYYFRARDNAGNYSEIKSITFDTKVPTMSFYNEDGDVANGSKVNSDYIAFRTDGTGSTIRSIYVLMPDTSSYVSADSMTQFLASGTYSFYCYDNAGNRSKTYSVTLDNEAPVLKVDNATFGETTTNSFRVTAEDDSVYELYYKGPNDLDYCVSSDNYVDVTTDMAEGRYYFYATDELGNRSEEVYIDLSLPLPEILIQYDESTNHYTLTWFDGSLSVGVNGMEYFSGAKLTEEGKYEILVIAQNGKTNTYNVTIDHKWVIVAKIEATCLAEGYTVNECLTCDGVIYGNWTGIGDHDVVVDDVIEPTCTTKGYTKYHCDYCLSQWESNYVDALGHNLEVNYVIEATCDNEGYTVYYCTTCMEEVIDDYVEPYEHEFYVADKVEANCVREGYTINKCKHCDVVINGEWTGIGDHSYTEKEVVAPTCSTEGYTIYFCDICLIERNDNYVDKLSHNLKVDYVIEATCDNEGYTVYYCTTCMEEVIDDYVEPYEHEFYVADTVEANCVREGYTINKCKHCDVVINGNWTGIGEHSYTEKKVVAPTCSTEGYTIYFCDVCLIERNDNYVDKLPHDYEETTYESNCMNQGYTNYKCLVCGYTYNDNYTETKEHDYEVTNKVGNCEEEGSITYKCTLCGYTYTENVGYGNHSYITTIIDPTCLENGYTKYECSLCKDVYYDNYKNATGHDYERNVVEPTCTTNGYTEYRCENCGDNYQGNITYAVGHKYIETQREPTCTESGGTFHTCIFCSNEYKTNEILPVGHSYNTEILKEPNCTNEGKRRYYCTKCADEYTIIIPAPGHNYQLLSENNKNGVVERTYKCSDCGDNYSESLGDQYDKVATYIIDLVNKYSPYIIYVFTATVGVWSIGMGVAYAVATKNEDKVKAKKMLVNYIIGIVAIFVILVALPYLVKGIAILLS